MKSNKSGFLRILLTILFLTLFLNSCFLKQDRTTVVYGTITDEKGQPVDSILVIVQGVKDFTYETIGEQYSNANGEYRITVEVPKKYVAVNSGIPFLSTNSKYRNLFKDAIGSKNGQSTNDCCSAQIGEKTRYDFQLIAK